MKCSLAISHSVGHSTVLLKHRFFIPREILHSQHQKCFSHDWNDAGQLWSLAYKWVQQSQETLMKFVWILSGPVTEVVLINVASEIVPYHSLECCLICPDYHTSVPETDNKTQFLSWSLSCCAAWILWWWKFRSLWKIHRALLSDMHTAWAWLCSVLHGLLWQDTSTQTLFLGLGKRMSATGFLHVTDPSSRQSFTHPQISFGEGTYWSNSCGTPHCSSIMVPVRMKSSAVYTHFHCPVLHN
jgi:hypothetical protein